MPYSIRKKDGRYCVVKKDDGKEMGCHDSRKDATAQMRAIHANESDEEIQLYLKSIISNHINMTANNESSYSLSRRVNMIQEAVFHYFYQEMDSWDYYVLEIYEDAIICLYENKYFRVMYSWIEDDEDPLMIDWEGISEIDIAAAPSIEESELSDDAFALISNSVIRKDEDDPKQLRLAPHHLATGEVDITRLSSALESINNVDSNAISKEALEQARRHLTKHMETFNKRVVLEKVDVSEAEIDGENDLIKNVVLISAGWSLNGRYYSKEALGRSTKKWEYARSYTDHKRGKEDLERSVMEQIGYYKEVHQDDKDRKSTRLNSSHSQISYA